MGDEEGMGQEGERKKGRRDDGTKIQRKGARAEALCTLYRSVYARQDRQHRQCIVLLFTLNMEGTERKWSALSIV